MQYTGDKTVMMSASNLESFLNYTTPSVDYFSPPKVDYEWNHQSVEYGAAAAESLSVFNLSDLWKSFEEWSAYGVGVPLTLQPCGQSIVQYYVPYLSALQIYWDPAASASFFRINRSFTRRSSDESDWSDASADTRDASSDFGSDSENFKLSRKPEQWESSSCVSSERPCSEYGEPYDQQGELVVEYFERCSPYGRAPFRRKIEELGTTCPYLFSLRSDELSPSSWISVAWYPIYRIPTGPTMNDLSTCFLTFHSLWTPRFPEQRAFSMEYYEHNLCCNQDYTRHRMIADKSPSARLGLPAFGLASYKLRGPFWASAVPADEKRASSLAMSAEIWLRQLGVKHPDFDFFTSRK